MHQAKAQAAALTDWVTLHPLFTIAGVIAVVFVIRLILRARRKAA